MKKKIIGYLLYIVALFLVVFYILMAIRPEIIIEFETTIIFIIISCLLIYYGGILLSKYYKTNKPLKINLWLYFILYILLFLNLTLLDSSWGRQGFLFIKPNMEFLKESVNLIPFRTIYEYLIANFNNLTSTSTIFYNVFGNFVALMPMAFFLPLLFPKENKFKNFFITILSIVLSIEIIQLIGYVGRFDIDDIILNVGGSLLMFKTLKIKEIDNLTKNIFLLEKNKIDIKKLIKILCIIGIILIAFILLVKYRDSLYKENLDNLHYDIQIVDESNDICDEALDKFYEDEFYNYYFLCQKSDKVYAIINDKDKYLVKDLLNNNPSKYEVDIKRIEEKLDFYKINYQKENKYTSVLLDINLIHENNSYLSPNINVNVLDKRVVETKLDYNNVKMDLDNEKYNIALHFIPKKVGTTTVEVSVFDNKELIDKKEYKIIVDKKLNVKYESLINE